MLLCKTNSIGNHNAFVRPKTILSVKNISVDPLRIYVLYRWYG